MQDNFPSSSLRMSRMAIQARHFLVACQLLRSQTRSSSLAGKLLRRQLRSSSLTTDGERESFMVTLTRCSYTCLGRRKRRLLGSETTSPTKLQLVIHLLSNSNLRRLVFVPFNCESPGG